MQFQKLKQEKLHYEYSVTISPETYETRLNERLVEVGKTAKISGFRPGKAPLSILKQRYEPGVKAQVIDTMVEGALENIYKDENVKPALKPEINFQSVNPAESIQFTVGFDVLPVIDPIKLEEMSLERLTAEVPKNKIEEAYDNLKTRNRVLKAPAKKRAAALGDVVTINFVGKCEGNLIPNGSGQDVPLELGSNSFIDTFETQLVGKKIGDHVAVKVTFPTDYQEKKLAGKPAEFSVDIVDIREYKIPDLNDEFAKTVGFETLESLEKAVQEQLQGEAERMSFLVVKRQLLDLLAENKFDIPQGLLDIEFKTIWKHYLDLQKENNPSATEQDKDKAQYEEIAERRVRLGLILADIGRRYDVTVTNKEMDNALFATIRRYPGQEKKVYEYFTNTPEAMATLRAPIFEDKVVQLILDKAKVTPKPVSYEELEKALKEVTEGEDD